MILHRTDIDWRIPRKASYPVDKRVHFLLARHADAQQRLAHFGRVRHLAVRWEEALEERPAEEHDLEWGGVCCCCGFGFGVRVVGVALVVNVEVQRDGNHGGVFVREGLVLDEA